MLSWLSGLEGCVSRRKQRSGQGPQGIREGGAPLPGPAPPQEHLGSQRILLVVSILKGAGVAIQTSSVLRSRMLNLLPCTEGSCPGKNSCSNHQ